jgi:lysophospholipase L1-like esterase
MSDLSARRIVVFPDERALERPGLERILQGVRFRFGDAVPITIAAPAIRRLGATPAGLEWAEPAAAVAMPGVDAWVLAASFLPVFHGEGGFERIVVPGDDATRAGKRLYLLEPDGFLHPLVLGADGKLDAPCTPATDPHLERNVFARMGSRAFRGAAYFFPYNGYYVGHPSAFGPIDQFGFRNAADVAALEKRAADHVLVAVFGGSTAWSPCCLQTETFSAVLERELNAALVARGDPRRASVLNFGVSGFTVVNELFTYLLFCHRLKPQIVIAHDLFNDLANGLQTDPELLGRYDLTYMAAMEQWAQTLMSAPHVALSQSSDPATPLRVSNSPQAIVRAYLARKRQFSDLVERGGATFVWGTQPAWFAKPPSRAEAERLERIRAQSPRLAPLYAALPQLYDMVRTALAASRIAHSVDLQARFAQLTAADDVFVDHAHLNPVGDAVIARAYADAILGPILGAVEEAAAR